MRKIILIMKKFSFVILILITSLGFSNSKKEIKPLGTYLFISENYEFEQILIFKENYEVIIFEKNHSKDDDIKSLDLLEKYSVFWAIQDDKLCFPLRTFPFNMVDERYCNDYYIDNNQLVFFEPGLGDKVEEIRFIKISDK